MADRMPGQNGPAPLSGNPELAFISGHSDGIEALSELGVRDIRHREKKGAGAAEPPATAPELSSSPQEKTPSMEKNMHADDDEIRPVSAVDEEATALPIGKGMTALEKVSNMEEIALYALHVEDDPSLDPWTFRTWFLGLGLSCFSATLATIYQFKPQGIALSATFLCVISYVLALALEQIPPWGWLGRLVNPGRFNAKEHAAILIMSSTAAHAAMAAEVIAVQKLWYETIPSPAVCIFLIFSSQILGYGIAGLMRKVLVYPTKFVYPENLPIMSLLETLHRKGYDTAPQLKVFYWAFGLIFFWEVLPQYMMPLLTAVNIFCLAKRDSMVFTRLFGGGNGNEGLGFLSLCFDFQYIGSGSLYLPPKTQANKFIGYSLCLVVFSGLYYADIWRARSFPFLSQLLFTPESDGDVYVMFNQSTILDTHGSVNDTLIAEQGVPYMTATFASYVLTQNLAITATISHLVLYNWDDLKSAWSFASPRSLRRLLRRETWLFWRPAPEPTAEEVERMDPHFRLMMRYADTPDWWYGLVTLASGVVGMVCIYAASSGMSWWSFLVAMLLATVLILFTGAQYGLTGFHVPVQPIVQMIGAYIQPGRPVTNMYFTLFGYNSVSQGLLLLKDLKLGQYAKLSPRCTFTMQLVGTVVGAVLNYVITIQITDAQREILTSIEGTHIWSGAGLQSFNTQAITWGGLAKYMYSSGSRYMWVPLGLVIGFVAPLPLYIAHRLWPKLHLDAINIPIIAWHIGWMVTGINSAIVTCFIVAFWSQYYLRRYKPEWFLRFNYVLCAGLDGGTQVIVFILSFAFLGASGNPVEFPRYWGNNQPYHIDYCMVDPASGKKH